VCLITFDKFLTNVKLFHVYIKVHKNGKYDFANTMKKTKSYANTPTWSKNSANSQCKAWICKKKISCLLSNHNPALLYKVKQLLPSMDVSIQNC
jgi:hypothetical protein